MEKYKVHCIELLKSRGVQLNEIAQLTYELQKKYVNDLTLELCLESVEKVLSKREVQFALMCAIEFDQLAEQKKYKDKLLEELVLHDDSMFGVDEVIAYGICNLYGSIALTNFGYVDKEKNGIVKVLNDDKTKCNTFIDDIVGAIAAAAASRFAHENRDSLERWGNSL